MKEEQEYPLPKLKKQKISDAGTPQSSHSIPPILPLNKSLAHMSHQNLANHRPVTSCSHCRQHKIKCDAHQNFPSPCSRCTKYGLHCEVDPQFKPKKGSQIQMMRRDIDELKLKVGQLLSSESILSKTLNESPLGKDILNKLSTFSTPNDLTESESNVHSPYHNSIDSSRPGVGSTKISVQTYLVTEPPLLHSGKTSATMTPNNEDQHRTSFNNSTIPLLSNTKNPNQTDGLPTNLQLALQRGDSINHDGIANIKNNSVTATDNGVSKCIMNSSGNIIQDTLSKKSPVVATTTTLMPLPSPYTNIDEFVLGDVHISIEKATRLHAIFVEDYLPYFPIMYTNSVTELYSQSQLLFWTTILTACLSDPEPKLYTQLSVLIKQLAIETCWMRTPRSTHISQALLILCIWPLPNQKVLDDCSYRFVGLAKSLSYQLGLHRGEFITEFTRSQTSMPNAEKWRTRTWLGIYFSELCWASILGLPPTSKTDYLVETALAKHSDDDESSDDNSDVESKSTDNVSDEKTTDESNFNVQTHKKDTPTGTKLPSRFKKLISLASFQLKLCNVMGSSVESPDGLIEPKERAGVLSVLNKELDTIARESNFQEDSSSQIYYLYVRLMVYCFAFFPETPIEHQSQYVTDSYLCATKIVTLLTKLLETQQLISLPIYLRQSATFASLILFKLQLTPLLPNQFLNSARQSIVTVHRLFRNQLTAWATVENDISRTASMLEKLNLVLITHSEVFVEESGVITRMRSHLTGSLFYDLVWCVHEARRREMDTKYNEEAIKRANEKKKIKVKVDEENWDRKLYPLPLYNHITRDDFKTITQTTPGGTTVTTLVPTKNALKHAEELAKNKDNAGSSVMEINGIPLFMLDETGSVKLDDKMLSQSNIDLVGTHIAAQSNSTNILQVGAINMSTQQKESNSGLNSIHSPVSDYSAYTNSNKNDHNIKYHTPQPLNTSSQSFRTSSNTQSLFSNPTISITPTGAPFTQIPKSNTHDMTREEGKYSNQQYSDPKSKTVDFKNLSSFLNNTKQFDSTPKAAQEAKSAANINGPTGPNGDTFPNPINDFFQQQGAGWVEGSLSNDDFFGWFDMNMEPEF